MGQLKWIICVNFNSYPPSLLSLSISFSHCQLSSALEKSKSLIRRYNRNYDVIARALLPCLRRFLAKAKRRKEYPLEDSQNSTHTHGWREWGGVNCNIHRTHLSESLSPASSHFTPDSPQNPQRLPSFSSSPDFSLNSFFSLICMFLLCFCFLPLPAVFAQGKQQARVCGWSLREL